MKFKFGSRFIPRDPRTNKLAPPAQTVYKDVELYPKLISGKEHPLPYYMTEEVSFKPLTDPPWKEDEEKEESERFQAMLTDPRLQSSFADSFLKETVDEEIMSIASSLLTEKKNKKSSDEGAVLVMEEDILVPTVQREVFVSVWELLYDWGRDLSPEEFQELQKRESELQMDTKAKDALTSHMFEGRDWSDDLKEEKKLSGHRWDVLLYNYYTKLLQNSFRRNAALHLMQERIISQAATAEVSDGLMSYLESDMDALDEQEKVAVPPRSG